MSIFHGEASPELGPVPSGFNWGAFLFSSVFLLANRRAGTFFLLLLGSFFLGMLGEAGGVISMIVGLVVSLYCGFGAKEIAWETGRHATYADLERSMRRWNIAALVFAGILVVLFLLASLG
jgi:hypothetical protein